LETIAVYREERVKVYGISKLFGISLGILTFPTEHIGKCTELLQTLETLASKFELITLQSAKPPAITLHLLYVNNSEPSRNETIQSWLADNPDSGFTVQHPVDLLFLHGPHFQDRDGIAEIAFSALKMQSIRALVVGCAGTSMYIVLPQGQGPIAHHILTETFLIPTSK